MQNFIGEFSVSLETVKGMLNYYEENIHLAKPGLVGDYEYMPDVKDSRDILLSVETQDKSVQQYFLELGLCLGKYKEKFPECSEKQQSWCIREPVILQRYGRGGGFKVFHCENNGFSKKNIQRHLAFMTYFNTIHPDEGGGTEFLYQGSFNSIAGKTLIWPAGWTHTHRGIISPTREKTIVTGWCR